MTIQNVLDNMVRAELRDPSKVRWPDANLLQYGVQAHRDILTKHPYLLLDADGDTLSDISDGSLALGTTLQLDTTWLPAMGAFILWKAFAEDSDDEANLVLSEKWHQDYLQYLGG